MWIRSLTGFGTMLRLRFVRRQPPSTAFLPHLDKRSSDMIGKDLCEIIRLVHIYSSEAIPRIVNYRLSIFERCIFTGPKLPPLRPAHTMNTKLSHACRTQCLGKRHSDSRSALFATYIPTSRASSLHVIAAASSECVLRGKTTTRFSNTAVTRTPDLAVAESVPSTTP